MSVLAGLLGDTVIDREGQTTNVSDLLDQVGPSGVIGLLFAANWSPPCREFTPLFGDFYAQYRESKNDCNMDIVFVSCDRNEERFKEYLAEMPWKALPFGDKDRKGKLSRLFKGERIPKLVFLEAGTGELVTTKGREAFNNDSEGKRFPWSRKQFSAAIKGELLRGEEKIHSDEALAGKVKGLYFSAHWCPPCKAFTPELAKTYEKLKAAGKNFQIVFVTSDRSDSKFKEYYGSMPWLAVPFKDPRIERLSDLFDVRGIPALVILDENNEIITYDGRSTLSRDKEGERFPWLPLPVEELTRDYNSNLYEVACLFLMTGGDAALQKSAVALMNDTAKAYKEELNASIGSDNELLPIFFCYEGPSPESVHIAKAMRAHLGIEGSDPILVFIDTTEERKYTIPANGLTKDTIRSLVEQFKAGTLPFVPTGY